MGELIRFERKKTDIENLYRCLDYQNIILIRVLIEKQKYIRLNDGTRTLEGQQKNLFITDLKNILADLVNYWFYFLITKKNINLTSIVIILGFIKG